MSGQIGEAEQKLLDLTDETIKKYAKGENINFDEVELSQEQVKQFIKDVMEEAEEGDAWDEEEFNTCFKEFDYDGSGEVSREELMNFIKRFAAL